jgi:hypothetical protein
MDDTSAERYAVVSCHVERPLGDEAWSRFTTLQRSRPGGFRIAALLRPADSAHGEDEDAWLARAREAAAHGPFGHHTHWTAPDHARPTSGDPGARVREEGARLSELGLAPTAFCGGGWYTDEAVAEACAELGYVDCTPRASRPGYLPADAPWASLGVPAVIELPSGATLPALPTTHSVGDLARALVRRALPGFVHVYFHDTDLLARRRRVLLELVLRALARRARPSHLDALARSLGDGAPRVRWGDVQRP